jgi:hypothetical protein
MDFHYECLSVEGLEGGFFNTFNRKVKEPLEIQLEKLMTWSK